jgi:hypothetical protein
MEAAGPLLGKGRATPYGGEDWLGRAQTRVVAVSATLRHFSPKPRAAFRLYHLFATWNVPANGRWTSKGDCLAIAHAEHCSRNVPMPYYKPTGSPNPHHGSPPPRRSNNHHRPAGALVGSSACRILSSCPSIANSALCLSIAARRDVAASRMRASFSSSD